MGMITAIVIIDELSETRMDGRYYFVNLDYPLRSKIVFYNSQAQAHLQQARVTNWNKPFELTLLLFTTVVPRSRKPSFFRLCPDSKYY